MSMRLFISLTFLLVGNAFIHQKRIRAIILSSKSIKVLIPMKASKDFEGYSIDQSSGSSSYERRTNPTVNTSTTSNSFPSRQDTCLMLFSGVIGTQPKEIYLRQGNYVVRFSVRLCFHFTYLFCSVCCYSSSYALS